MYGASEGLHTLVLDKIGPGGQAGTSSRIENYMGFPTGLSGTDLANRAVTQAEKFGAIISAPAEIAGLRSENGYHVLVLKSGEEALAKSVVIAAGATYRTLDVPGGERFESTGVYYAATAMEAQLCRLAPVVIVGGGNSAGQAAIFLAEHSARVLLVIRGDDLGRNMSHYLVRRIEQTPNIEVRRHARITAMHGDESLDAVELTRGTDGQSEIVECRAVFVFIGAIPQTEWLPETIQVDRNGFVETGPRLTLPDGWPLKRPPFLLETSCPGIFAAGDVRLGSTKRVASAVGEGAMAVQFVHEYLSTAPVSASAIKAQ